MSTTRTPPSGAVTELWGYRSLIRNLARRDLSARYKKSVLGWAWSLINPASTLLIYSVVFGTILKVTPPPGHNPSVKVFALYLFTGLIIWNCFNAVLTGAIGALQGVGTLLNKVYFPPACPAVAATAVSVTQSAIETSILIVAMLIARNAWWTILLLPLVFVPAVALSLGIGLALSAYNVLYRDVAYLVTIGLNLLFYATPIVYPITLVPEPLRTVFEANPLTQLVGIARDLAYFGQLPSLGSIAYTLVISAVVLVLGWKIFEAKARLVIEDL